MADTAAHLVDRVIPAVPVRQWVLSLPYSLRFRAAFDSALLGRILGIFVREVFGSLRRRARENGIPQGKCGSVTFVQRFGSALNLTPHFHLISFDGVYACAEEGEPPRFYPLRPPAAKDVVAVAARVAERVAALMEKREGVVEQEAPDMADLVAASIAGRLSTGPNAGQKVKTAGVFHEESFESHGSRCAMVSGYSVHAGVSIRASDRKGLERLLRGRPSADRGRTAGAVAGWAAELSPENAVERRDNSSHL